MEEQLSTEPTRPTRNRKVLVNLVPPWTAERLVYVRAIRRKPAGRTTEEIL
jgi:hypothetical protein